MRKIFSTAAIVLLTCAAAWAADMGMTSQSFLRTLGYASARIQRGISPSSISSNYRKTDTGCAVEYDSSIMLVINEDAGGKISNLAAVYMPDTSDSEPHTHYMKGGPPRTEQIYENICIQVMLALEGDLTMQKAKETLRDIGLYGKSLDGIQRSSVIGEHKYIMKMQPSGLLLMAVSHI